MSRSSNKQTAKILRFKESNPCSIESLPTFTDLLDRCDGSVSNLLLLLRETFALTQEELGKVLDLDKSCICRIESGKYKKPERLLPKMKKLYDKGAFESQAKKEKKRKMATTIKPESHLSVIRKENRKKLPFYKIYAKKTYAETGATPDLTEILLKRIKRAYKAFRENECCESLNNFAWNNILNGKRYSECYLALANFLLEWNSQCRFKLVQRIEELPYIYFKEVLFPYFKKVDVAPQPFQILSESLADKWREYWTKRIKEDPNLKVEEQTFTYVPEIPKAIEIRVADSEPDFVAGIDYDVEVELGEMTPLEPRILCSDSRDKEKEFDAYYQNLMEEGGAEKVLSEIERKMAEMCGGEAEYRNRMESLRSLQPEEEVQSGAVKEENYSIEELRLKIKSKSKGENYD